MSKPQPRNIEFSDAPIRTARGVSERVAVIGSATIAVATLAACTGSLNTTDDLLDAEPFPALTITPPGLGVPDDGPSLRSGTGDNGWDRRHWDVVVVRSPRGQTETNPAGAARLPVDCSLPRQRGEFPVDAEVLDGTGDPGAVALDAAVNLAAAPGLLLVAPLLELVHDGRWPWSVVRQVNSDGLFHRGSGYDRLPPDSPRTPWPWLGIEQD